MSGFASVPFRVRRVPLNFCAMHHQVGVWAEDGTERWHCAECIDDGLYRAEHGLRLWRVVHGAGHAVRKNKACPYCNPRADA